MNPIDPIHLAAREAKKSPHKFTHGAVILDRRGNIVGRGYNNSLHAEIQAMLKCSPEQRKGATIYSIRLSGAQTKLCNAKPCPACQETLKKYGVTTVYYSNTAGEIRKMKLINGQYISI